MDKLYIFALTGDELTRVTTALTLYRNSHDTNDCRNTTTDSAMEKLQNPSSLTVN